MDFFRFLTTKLFLRHLALAAVIALILLLGTLLGLRIYTHHGHTITVPDLSGLTVEEVEDVCNSRDLRFVVMDRFFPGNAPGNGAQTPTLPLTQVKKNRKIFLTMNALNPETVSMPQLVGLSIRQARLALENAGLQLGDITYEPSFAINNVLQQMHKDSVITEGAEISKESVIDLVLGMGLSNETTRVPDLVGLGLAEAKSIMADYFLNLGAVTYDERFPEKEKDTLKQFIWRQYPEFDEFKRLNMGMEIDVWMTADSSLLPLPDSTLTIHD
ncbi:MAG: PASTA domain-containing protein [Bacteroidales bacterium]